MKKVLFSAIATVVVAIFIVTGCGHRVANNINVSYAVRYVSDGEIVFSEEVKMGKRAPDKQMESTEDYRFIGWKYKELPYNFTTAVKDDMTLIAEWRAIDYCVEFVCDGEVISTVRYNAEDKNVVPPEIPEVEGFIGYWESYELGGKNIRVNAVYKPKEYTVTFIAGDKVVGKVGYTVYDSGISCPDVPEVEFYDGRWEDFSLSGEDLEVYACYSPHVYKVDFYADGRLAGSREYDVENKNITPPPVPEKEGYDGAWKNFSLEGGDVRVDAEYIPHKYKVTFVADGEVVARLDYDCENGAVPPAVPEKAGYKGAWEEYSLDGGDKVVNAVYVLDDAGGAVGTEGLVYTACEGGFTVSGYEGKETAVVIPTTYKSVPVLAISDGAFSGNDVIASLTCGKNLKTIGENAFFGCANLSEIKLGGAESIGANAFAGTAVEKVVLPDTLTQISDYLFYCCTKLIEVVVPDGVKSIGKMAFGGCGSLERVSLGAGIELIEANAFVKCDKLAMAAFADPEGWVIVNNGAGIDVSEKFSSPQAAAQEIKNHCGYAFRKIKA